MSFYENWPRLLPHTSAGAADQASHLSASRDVTASHVHIGKIAVIVPEGQAAIRVELINIESLINRNIVQINA